ncbi:MAG: hypothetical protein ACLUAR_16820 [Pilosibacter sp.]
MRPDKTLVRDSSMIGLRTSAMLCEGSRRGGSGPPLLQQRRDLWRCREMNMDAVPRRDHDLTVLYPSDEGEKGYPQR